MTIGEKRIVVTGIGMVTPLGGDTRTTWAHLIKGMSGIDKIPTELFDTNGFSCKIAGFIPTKEQNPERYLNMEDHFTSKELRQMDRFIQHALVAAKEAIQDSGWVAQSNEQQERTGVLVGSGIGGLSCITNNASILRDEGPRRISPFFIPASLINLIPGHIAIKYGFKGPNYSIATACATGAHCIGEAARLIKCGVADVMVCGGSEAAITSLGIVGFDAARALSTKFNDEPTKASRPWDKARDGFIMGEGAGVLVIESYDNAKKRGAKIYAELVGYGLSGDAYHITAPEPSGIGGLRAMKMALQESGLRPEEIDYINAHGTSTNLGDMIELNAIRTLLGDDHMSKVAISSTKSAIGHLLGAAGAVEAAFSLLAIDSQIVPPTLNLYDPEEECKNINFVPHKAMELKPKVVLSNSFGFGGTNCALLFKQI